MGLHHSWWRDNTLSVIHGNWCQSPQRGMLIRGSRKLADFPGQNTVPNKPANLLHCKLILVSRVNKLSYDMGYSVSHESLSIHHIDYIYISTISTCRSKRNLVTFGCHYISIFRPCHNTHFNKTCQGNCHMTKQWPYYEDGYGWGFSVKCHKWRGIGTRSECRWSGK